MNANLFANVFEQSQPMLETVAKVNRLAISELEKVVALQTSNVASLTDFCLGQLKAASEIRDPSSLQGFYNNQVEALNVLRQKIVDDSQALAALGVDFKNELTKLIEQGVVDLVPKAVKAEERQAA